MNNGNLPLAALIPEEIAINIFQKCFRLGPDIRQFKHQTLFATQTQTQYNLIVKANQMYRIYHTLISHWPKNLGYVGFEFTLQLTFGA